MGKADTLSCQEDHAISVADDNKGIMVISPDQIHSSSTPNLKSLIFDALATQAETEVYHLCKEKGICKECDGFLYNSSSWMYVPDMSVRLSHTVLAKQHSSQSRDTEQRTEFKYLAKQHLSM